MDTEALIGTFSFRQRSSSEVEAHRLAAQKPETHQTHVGKPGTVFNTSTEKE